MSEFSPDEPRTTGHPEVDSVLASLDRLDDLSVAEHVTVFESAHERLRGVLADAGKSVAAMVDAMDAERPPLRLALGSGAYASIRKALSGRLAALEAQKDIALAVDADA